MTDTRSPADAGSPHAVTGAPGDARQATLRQLGTRAHQLSATARAADHFTAQDASDDRDTGAWLMSTAVALAADLAADIDGLARGLRDGPSDAGFAQLVRRLRVRAYQLHASARAADHFLEQESAEDHETGSWLVASARTLANQLASELDDGLGGLRRSSPDSVMDAQEAALQRRVQAATPVRGVA